MQGIHLFSIKGIPVGVHPMFLLLLAIFCIGEGGIAEMVLFGISMVLGILGHELGHALVADRFGLRPEILLHGWGGVTRHSRTGSAKQSFLITLAGPMVGIVVGGSLFVVDKLVGVAVYEALPYLYLFLNDMIFVNLVWGIFNLLPVQPMDGGKILQYLLSKICRPMRAEKIAIVISIVFSLALLGLAIWMQQIFMIIISGYFVVMNAASARGLFFPGDAAKRLEKVSKMRADVIYEKGLIAAREHEWEKLEMLGYQMKNAAEGEEQIGRAYEFLTIACTNQGKYAEAMNFSRFARQSDAVKQAIARCRSMMAE